MPDSAVEKLAKQLRRSKRNSVPPCRRCGRRTGDQRGGGVDAKTGKRIGGICGKCAFPNGLKKSAAIATKFASAAGDVVDELRAELRERKAAHDRACQTIEQMHRAATGRFGEAPRRGVVEDVADLQAELEQERVRLAGCLTAADGAKDDLKRDAYGWSPAYERVAELRRAYDALCARRKVPVCDRQIDENSKQIMHDTACRRRPHVKQAALPLLAPLVAGAGRMLAGAGARSALKAGAKSVATGAATQLGMSAVSRFGPKPSASPMRTPMSPAAAPAQPFATTII